MAVSEPWLGRPIDRVDGPDKVRGGARYTAEAEAAGLLHAVVIDATRPKGQLRSADTAAVEAVPGVVAVWTMLDAPPLDQPEQPKIPYEQPALKILSPPYYVLQENRVRFWGDIAGLVVAETSEAAHQAARLIRFDYEEVPPALAFDADTASFEPESLITGLDPKYRRGDAEEALASAEVTIDAVYETPSEHHNPIELAATVARFEDGKLTVHTTTQDPHGARMSLANSLELELDKVRVISRYLGGGFGSKYGTWPQTVLAAFAARELGRPVRLELSRKQMFALNGHRARHWQRVRLGANRDGTLQAIAQDIRCQTDTERRWVEHTGETTHIMYGCPNVRIDHAGVPANLPPNTIMRAPGSAPGMFAFESAMDELAMALGMDPIDLRLKNEPENDPDSGLPWSSRGLARALREGAERFGWSRRDPSPRSMRDGRWLIGWGVASAVYPAFRLPCGARVRVSANGEATVETAATDIGTGTYTILSQIAADALGLEPGAVSVVIGDTDLPKTPGSGGSWGAVSYGTAVKEACEDLLKKLGLERPEPGAIVQAMRARGEDEARGEAMAQPPKDKGVSSYSFGAHFVEVRVDPDTCEIRVPRALGVFGVGRAFNPKTARSQLMGGMVWGLGMALTEASVVDLRYGHFVNSDLAEYHVPVNADIRDLDTVILDEEDGAVTPLGGKGLGEVGIVGMAAAVANAVHHATGVRVRKLPITIESLAGRL